jgi:hypothetical protein
MTRSDTVAGQVEAFSAASDMPQPPAHMDMRECDWPFWQSIILARPIKSWTSSDLELAVNLCKDRADVKRLREEVQGKDIVVLQNGNGAVNPKHKLIETMERRIISMSRLLHVHAEANMTAKDRAAQAQAERQAREKQESVSKNHLLARPSAAH